MVRRILRKGFCVAFWLCSIAVSEPTFARCRADLPANGGSGTARRPLQLDDLVRLRDIGPTASVSFLNSSAVGVAPEGRRIAVQLRQADPVTNSYCQAIVVIDLESAAPPRVVDRGGTMIRIRFQRGSLADYFAGDAKLITPIWSPDGKNIAFLKQTGKHVQVWLAQADGGGSRQLTNAPVNVEAFAWRGDGAAIVIETRPALDVARRAITKEGLNGYHYDDRWSPVASNHPWPSEPQPSIFQTIGLLGGTHAASAVDRALVEKPLGTDAPAAAGWVARSERNTAWVAPAYEEGGYYEGRIELRRGDRSVERCPAPECTGNFRGLWWSKSGEAVWFLRREGYAKSELALYRWTPGEPAAHRVLTTPDLLAGCGRAANRLICTIEQSSRPRRIVSIDPRDGTMQDVFDPNPEFASLNLGTVERLKWRNDQGIDIYGDLVLPPGWDQSRGRLPLIIVQYQTRGFLRGGTDDEFPIFAFAANGFAVLSLERPGYVADQGVRKSPEDRIRLNYTDWADRRSVLSAFATGIALLDRRGIIDPARVGISGLSDGTASAQFAISSSNLFAAASLSACCEDPNTLFPMLGNNGAQYLRKRLYPAYSDPANTFWAPYSMARNAARLKTPLLMQSADDEYLMALESYTSLREHAVPVELYVFPDEHHMKWQPAHRLALYRRNIAWFGFWLKGDAGGYASPDETKRWSEMRTAARLPVVRPNLPRR